MSEIVLLIFYFIILVYSIIIHEVSHGFVALWLGDPTAKYAGRLNLNPVRHIDPFGSVIVPIFMYLIFNFTFGWAKPVPYNPYNLRNQKTGPVWVALGGPLSNLSIALAAAVIARLLPIVNRIKLDIFENFAQAVFTRSDLIERWSHFGAAIQGSLLSIFFGLCLVTIFWNVILAVFNLIPIPPLDGSKVLFYFLRLNTETQIMLEQFGFVLLFLFIFLFGGLFSTVLGFALNLFFSLAV